MREYEYTLTLNHDIGQYVAEVPELGLSASSYNVPLTIESLKSSISSLIKEQIFNDEMPIDGFIKFKQYYIGYTQPDDVFIPEQGNEDVYYGCSINEKLFDLLPKERYQEAKNVFHHKFFMKYQYMYHVTRLLFMMRFEDSNEIDLFVDEYGIDLGLKNWKRIDKKDFFDKNRILVDHRNTLISTNFFPQIGETMDGKYYFLSDEIESILNERLSGETLEELYDRLKNTPEYTKVNFRGLFENPFYMELSGSPSPDSSPRNATEQSLENIRKKLLGE